MEHERSFTYVGDIVEGLLAALEHRAGLLTQGVLRVPWDPFAPRRGPLGSSSDRERAIENAPTTLLLTELSPQAPGGARRRGDQPWERAQREHRRGDPDCRGAHGRC